MKINKTQRDTLTKWVTVLSTYTLTALPVGLFLKGDEIPLYTYALIFVSGISFLLFGLYLNKNADESKDTMTTEVKKGIFHISRAEIAH